MEPDQTPVALAPIPPYEYPVEPVARSSPAPQNVNAPEQPKSKPNVVQPFQRPPTRPTKPFIKNVVPETPVRVAPEQPRTPVQSVVMSHPETVTLPPTQEVERYKKPEVVPQSEVRSSPIPTSRRIFKPEEKASIQKNNLQKPEEKASKGGKNTKNRKFNGGGGRIHTEAQIDQILDWYIETGDLPDYVSERQRHSYRHHIRLPERRELLDKQQSAVNKASGSHSATGHKNNITQLPRTGTHDT